MKTLSVIFTLIVSIILISLVSATLTISPNPITIQTRMNELNTFNATFTNNFNFRIQDFSFTNLTGFSFPQITLDPAQSLNIEFTVERNSPIETSIPSSVRFNYLVDVPSNPQTHYINITSVGFIPQFIVIHEQDTIAWTNIDTISHTVTSSFFDLTVLPNQTVERIFTQSGTINYQDLVLYFGGTIEVLNRTSQQAVHNPQYDIIWNVDLSVIADPTELEIEPFGGVNFTVEAIGSTEGLFRIKNIGDEIAQSIQLSTEDGWLTFDENNFNLGIGEQKFVDYTIAPIIWETNETNKTYDIDIKAKALNSEEVTFGISVFVPFLDMETGLTEEETLLILWERICHNNPNAPLCTGILESGGNGSVIYADPEFQFNFTSSMFLDLLRRQRNAEDTADRTANRVTTIEQLLATNNPEMLRILNESITKQLENEDRIRRNSNLRWITGFFILASGAVIFIGVKYRRYNEKKKLVEGYG